VAAVLLLAVFGGCIIFTFMLKREKGPTYVFSEDSDEGTKTDQRLLQYIPHEVKPILHQVSCVKSVGECHDPNTIFRPTMEVIIDVISIFSFSIELG
jgi:hypothetical protein